MTLKEEGPSGEDNVTYPSPETIHAGPFYGGNGHDGSSNEQMHDTNGEQIQMTEGQHQHEPNHEQEQHHHLHGQEQHHEHPHDHHQDQQHGRPANIEELQLAAQLGHGLADGAMMAATDPNLHVEDASMHAEDPNLRVEEQDHRAEEPNMQVDGQDIRVEDPNMRVDDVNIRVEDPSLRSILPHPEPEQQEHHHSQPPPQQQYMPDAPTNEGMVQHGMPMPVPPQMPPHYGLNNDGVPPRKRSKVSRACDECRRKKIKCDATSDSGETACTSCAKSNVRCLFSRVPQKRGPSKGYIKELADRINSIESKLQSEDGLGHEDLEKFFAQERQRSSAGPAEETTRKRPFSNISGNEFSTPTSNNRQTPWGSDAKTLQAGTENFGNYSNSAMAPQPSAIKPDATPSKPPVATMDVPMPDGEDVPEVGDDILHDYVTLIKPLYPVLPNDRSKLQSLLVQSPSPVRTGFLNAVMAIAQPAGGNAKLASSLLNDWENTDSARTMPANIVHAQALILLIIDADMRASSTLPFLLSRAVALANSMKLWKVADLAAAAEADSDEQLCVRIWWSLVLLDRWHAAGTGKPLQIPESSVIIPAGLEAIVGENCFFLIRLSKVLGKAATTIASLPTNSTTAEPMTANILNDYVENFREDLPSYVTAADFPMVHQAYWHSRLLIALLNPDSTPNALLWPTTELITLLITASPMSEQQPTAPTDVKTPLTHHFTNLIVLALAKLVHLDDSRQNALQLARDIVQQPGIVWEDVTEKLAHLVRPAVEQTTEDAGQADAEAASGAVEADVPAEDGSAEADADADADAAATNQGLQHLADLATAGNGGAAAVGEENNGLAQNASLALGYLELV